MEANYLLTAVNTHCSVMYAVTVLTRIMHKRCISLIACYRLHLTCNSAVVQSINRNKVLSCS
jgi:hypothetical protein